MAYTTAKEVRNAFFNMHPQYKRVVIKQHPGGTYRDARHNEYPADTRCAFVAYIDDLARSGEISEALASRVTL